MTEINPDLPTVGDPTWGPTLLGAIGEILAQGNANDAIIGSGRLSEPELSATIAGTGASFFQPITVHIICGAGQSLMSGRGAEYSTFLDPTNDRIYQYGSKVRTLRLASEPLDMHDTPTGMGPLLQFARQYLRTLPPRDIVVVAPTAHGSTMIPTIAMLGWRAGNPGNLLDQAIVQIEEAVEAVQEMFPGASITVDGILWAEGETASNTTNMISGETYQPELDAVIDEFRDRLDAPNLPFIIGQMIPEAMGVGTREEINEVHADTPHRVPFTGFAMAPPPGFSNGDALHANAAAYRLYYGPRYFEEFQRIKAGIAPTTPQQPAGPSTGGAVFAADPFTAADGPVSVTPTGGLAYSTGNSTGLLPVLSYASSLGQFTANVGAGTSWWLLDPGEKTRQRKLEVITSGSHQPRVILEFEDSTHQIFAGRVGSGDQRWRVWIQDGGSAVEAFTSSIAIAGTQEFTWEPRWGYWYIWIDGVYIGRVPQGPAEATAFGAGFTFASGVSTAVKWGGVGVYALAA